MGRKSSRFQFSTPNFSTPDSYDDPPPDHGRRTTNFNFGGRGVSTRYSMSRNGGRETRNFGDRNGGRDTFADPFGGDMGGRGGGRKPGPFDDPDKDDKDEDCCCFTSNSVTQLYVTSFILFFLGVCGGIASAALGSQRCCGSAWSNEDHVSLACSAVYRSCYDVTRSALGVGISGATLLLIGFLVLGLACHCQHQKRQDKKHKQRTDMLREREMYTRQARKEKREREEIKEEREREREKEREERDREEAREKEMLELARNREEREILSREKENLNQQNGNMTPPMNSMNGTTTPMNFPISPGPQQVGPPIVAYQNANGYGPGPMGLYPGGPPPPHNGISPRQHPAYGPGPNSSNMSMNPYAAAGHPGQQIPQMPPHHPSYGPHPMPYPGPPMGHPVSQPPYGPPPPPHYGPGTQHPLYPNRYPPVSPRGHPIPGQHQQGHNIPVQVMSQHNHSPRGVNNNNMAPNSTGQAHNGPGPKIIHSVPPSQGGRHNNMNPQQIVGAGTQSHPMMSMGGA